MKTVLRFLFSLSAFLAVWSFSGAANATTYTHNWCFKWRVTMSDASYGDYGTGSLWLARGALIAVQHAQTGTQTYYASTTTGCISFTSTVKSNFTVRIHAASRQGGSNNVMVRAFATKAHYDAWNAFKINDNLEEWIWVGVNPTCTGTSCDLSLTNTGSADMVSNMVAIGAWVFRQIDINTSQRLTGTRELFLINASSGCSGGVGSCQAGDIVYVQPADSGAQRKFLIGHEVGHWLEQQWIGGAVLSPNSGVVYNVQDWSVNGVVCDSEGIVGNHALRSAEYQLGGFTEGIAHYFSTLAFNDHTTQDGEFKYYKSDTNPGPYNYDLVDVENGPTGGNTAWLRYSGGCNCATASEGCANYGVELDWLRFYWDYRTNPDTMSEPQPTHRDIFDHLANTYNYNSARFGLTDTETRLENRVDPSFAVRWDHWADYNAADPIAD